MGLRVQGSGFRVLAYEYQIYTLLMSMYPCTWVLDTEKGGPKASPIFKVPGPFEEPGVALQLGMQ